MVKVLVGITTYKRPRMLERLLRSIERIETDADVRILVADNDLVNREGMAVVRNLVSAGYRFPLNSLVIESRGFTYGRNAIFGAGFADPEIGYVAILDDDQHVEPQWIDELLKVQKETGADIVAGRVIPEFEVPPQKWIIESRAYAHRPADTGTVEMLTGDANTLVSRSVTKLLPVPWYDHDFALMGGADTDFFIRLKASGGRFARAGNAVVYEVYTPTRMTLSWVLKRSYRSGNSDILIARKNEPERSWLFREAAKIPFAAAFASFELCLFFWSPGRRVDALRRALRAFGKLAGIFGARYAEYAKSHGE